MYKNWSVKMCYMPDYFFAAVTPSPSERSWAVKQFCRSGRTGYCNFLFHHVTHTGPKSIFSIHNHWKRSNYTASQTHWMIHFMIYFIPFMCLGNQQEVTRLTRAGSAFAFMGPKNSEVWGSYMHPVSIFSNNEWPAIFKCDIQFSLTHPRGTLVASTTRLPHMTPRKTANCYFYTLFFVLIKQTRNDVLISVLE